MVYRHETKAGNRADVWKHYLLSEILERRLSRTPGRILQFRYFETHGGPGIYRLRENGAWRSGAAIFARNRQGLPENRFTKSLPPPEPDGIYNGSWILAGRILLERGRRPILEICDTVPEIASAGFNPEIPPPIRNALIVHRADGFEVLRRAIRPDFVLIDPPYAPEPQRDWQQALSAADRLATQGIAGLLWYPVYRHKTLAAPETGRLGYELIWGSSEHDGKMIGCGLMGIGSVRDDLFGLTDQMQTLADVLSGHFRTCRLTSMIRPQSA